MALSHSWSTAVKVVLPLLVIMAIAMKAPSNCSAEEHVVHDLAEAATRANAGGRFSSSDEGASIGRKLLNINFCGSGQTPNFNCKRLFPFYKNAQCCRDKLNNRICLDVGGSRVDRCGSCNTVCSFGQVCCRGVCADLRSDRNNCGHCGNVCRRNAPCRFGLCGY